MEFSTAKVPYLFNVGEIYIPGEGMKKGIFQNNTLVSVEEQHKNYNELPRNDLLNSKELSHNSHNSHQSKTRQTFRSRAYSTNTKSTKPNPDNQARVFKLVDLKDNLYNVGNQTKKNNASRDESFHSTISNNAQRGFIRFGQGNEPKERKTNNSRSIDSKKERIMHSAFYMHKFHNEF